MWRASLFKAPSWKKRLISQMAMLNPRILGSNYYSFWSITTLNKTPARRAVCRKEPGWGQLTPMWELQVKVVFAWFGAIRTPSFATHPCYITKPFIGQHDSIKLWLLMNLFLKKMFSHSRILLVIFSTERNVSGLVSIVCWFLDKNQIISFERYFYCDILGPAIECPYIWPAN